jgi:hypothetical protein
MFIEMEIASLSSEPTAMQGPAGRARAQRATDRTGPREPVHKRYPAARHYFAPQVERVPFPPASIAGADRGRWVRHPTRDFLKIGHDDATATLRIELLEIFRVALTYVGVWGA